MVNSLPRRVLGLAGGILLSGLAARPCLADEICRAPAAAAGAPAAGAPAVGAPAVTIAVTCDESAISRYFLLSPALSALSGSERAAAVSDPVRYAFVYMSADAVNRLHAAFADPAVRSVDLTETLMARNAAGQPAPHEMFRVVAGRADVAGIDWATLAPPDLFKIVPSQFSPFLVAALKPGAAKP